MSLMRCIRTCFGFTRQESQAFVLLVPIVFMFVFAAPIYRAWFEREPKMPAIVELSYIDTLQNPELDSVRLILKTFDPNTVTEKELTAMGLAAPVAARIVHFREAGGTFRQPEELLKIYGVDSIWFERVRKWVTINSAQPPPRKRKPERFDINEADSMQLISLRGIGPYLANRIIRYRQSLGGFVDVGQLREVYRLDSLLVSDIIRYCYVNENFIPQKININTCTVEMLAAHPYLSWQDAKAIVMYRVQHGDFTTLDNLTSIKLLDEKKIARLKPYLTLE